MSRKLSVLAATLCIWGCDDAPWWPPGGAGGNGGGGGGCEEPSPEGCRNAGCPDGMQCVVGDECVPSSCECDEATGAWICTEDCGGGVCEPADACADHRCQPWQACRVFEPTGEAYCADTCDGFECRDDQVCELQEVQCVRAPCPPIARCVPAADPCALIDCREGFECRVNANGEGECVPSIGCENVLCEAGTVCEMQDGRPVCVPLCRGENPAGCREAGCPRGARCAIGDACVPSQCRCDPNTREWACTDDCGGGECVPVITCDNVLCEPGHICEMQDGQPVCVPICEGENPAGCRENGCPDGQVCEVGDSCNPSQCRCDPATRQWACTDDCGGGECVPEVDACDLIRCLPDHHCELTADGEARCVPNCAGPNPAGCRANGCPDGQRCELEGSCNPSACECDADSGQWLCTDDCGGGACVPELDCRNVRCLPGHVCEMQDGRPVCVPVCRGENPAGCRNTGCPAGQRCDVENSCVPSACECDFDSGEWLCTADCGGGQCVPELTCDNVLCAPGSRCEMQDGRPVCVPVLSCENVLCAPGFVCRETPEGPECVPACGPNPAGCLNIGCPDGQRCAFPEGSCTPSSCRCDAATGAWACTRDCGGGVCVDDPCADHRCLDHQACRVHEGEPYCADTCEGFPCERGEVCELQEVQCVRAPCPPIARCVPAADPCADHRCLAHQVCRVHEGEPYCADSCENFPCPEGEACRLTEVQCVRAPCPPVAECVPRNPCEDIRCQPHQVCEVFEGEAYCADTCRNFPCEAGTHCELQEVQCVRAPCPPIAACVPDAENQWYLTCGDPVCRGHTPRDDIPRCQDQRAGDPCNAPGRMCDPGDGCNALLVCADSDPRDQGCPISEAAKKQGIEYLDAAEIDALAAKVKAIKLAKWQYKANPVGQHFGFIIDDGVPTQALRATGDQVDLYGYTSLAVATLQAQSRQLEAMQAQLDALQKQVADCR